MSEESFTAKIVSAGGVALGLSSSRSAHKGMMGISISNHFFSNERVAKIVELGTALCSSFAIVIFDYPERWNWPLKQDVTQAENEKRCLVIGGEKKAAYFRELRKLGLELEVPILRWQDISEQSEYERNVLVLQQEFTHNVTFRAAVARQLETNLGARVAGRPLDGKAKEAMCNYLLEEIAGLFYLQFDLDYQIDLYPKPQMDIIQDIYTDKYPTITARMGYDWSKQGWVEVGF